MLRLEKIQLHETIQNNHLYRLFHVPIPDEAYSQFVELQSILDDGTASEELE
jgi:hypothetical protein